MHRPADWLSKSKSSWPAYIYGRRWMHVVQAAIAHSRHSWSPVNAIQGVSESSYTTISSATSSFHGNCGSSSTSSSMLMLEPVLPAAMDHLLLHGCLIVSVSSLLIMLALQPLLPGGSNVATASRAVLVRLLSGRSDDGDGGGVSEAPAPPPPSPRRRSRNSRRRHCCERCAASSWSDVVAAVTASLRLDDDGDDEGIAAAACGGCAAAAAVEELLERKEATEQELREAFYVFDRDEDGFVGAGELWNVLRRLGMLPDEEAMEEDCCARMIAAHDADGDGRISFPEFRAMMEHAA